MKRYMLVLHHRPLFATDRHFDFHPRFFPWRWLAWCAGVVLMGWHPHATGFHIFRGERVR